MLFQSRHFIAFFHLGALLRLPNDGFFYMPSPGRKETTLSLPVVYAFQSSSIYHGASVSSVKRLQLLYPFREYSKSCCRHPQSPQKQNIRRLFAPTINTRIHSYYLPLIEQPTFRVKSLVHPKCHYSNRDTQTAPYRGVSG